MEITVSGKAISVDGEEVCWPTQIEKLEWLNAHYGQVEINAEADAFATGTDEEEDEKDYYYHHADNLRTIDLDERSGIAWL